MNNTVNNILGKSTQRKSSLDVESNLPDYLQKNNALDHFMQSYVKKKAPCNMFGPLGYAVPNLSGIPNGLHTVGYTDKNCSLGLPIDPFDGDHGCKYYQRLDQCRSSLEVNKVDEDSVSKNLPCLRNITFNEDVSDVAKINSKMLLILPNLSHCKRGRIVSAVIFSVKIQA